MNILLNTLLFSFAILIIIFLITIFNYIKFIIFINKNKDSLNLPKNITEKIEEYWGLNILRQNHDVWDDIGKTLSNKKLLSLWKKTDQYYEILKKILLIELIIVIIFIVYLILLKGN